MAKIVFVGDPEEGHIIPTFGLAHSLKKRGHEVHYLSILDNEDIITSQGFTFYSIFEELYPKGFKKKFKERNLLPGKEKDAINLHLRKTHLRNILDGAYTNFIQQARADVYLVSFYNPFELLIFYYKYKIRPVIFDPIMRRADMTPDRFTMDFIANFSLEEKCMLVEFLTANNINFTSFEELTQPFGKLHELIAGVREFEIGLPLTSPRITYIGPSLRKVAEERDIYNDYNIPREKKIMYTSMGSQTIRHGADSDIFFRKVIKAVSHESLQDKHLILCVGPEYDKSQLEPVPPNVTLLNWGPQIDIIKVASVAIIHGGLGGVKECIYYGVPMIVLPQAHDQPMNARRVEFHKLGFADDSNTVSEEKLRNYLVRAMSDPVIRAGIEKMQAIFHKAEAMEEGVAVIENILEQKTNGLLRSS